MASTSWPLRIRAVPVMPMLVAYAWSSGSSIEDNPLASPRRARGAAVAASRDSVVVSLTKRSFLVAGLAGGSGGRGQVLVDSGFQRWSLVFVYRVSQLVC